MKTTYDMDDVATEWIDDIIVSVSEFNKEYPHAFVAHTREAMEEFKKNIKETLDAVREFKKTGKL